MDLLTTLLYKNLSTSLINQIYRLIQRDRSQVYPFLGAGFHGEAFDIGDGKIFKITSDRNDALGSLALLQESNPHLMQIHSVFQINDIYYGIVAEKLEELTSEENQQWNLVRVLDTSFGKNLLQEYGVSEPWLQVVKVLLKESPGDERLQRAKLDQDKLDALEAWSEIFKKHDIVWTDIQGENILKKDGRYVLSDFGGMGERPNLLIPRVGEKVNGLFLKAVAELTLEEDTTSALALCEMMRQFRGR